MTTSKQDISDRALATAELEHALTVRSSNRVLTNKCRSRRLRNLSVVFMALVLLCLAPGISRADTFTLDAPGQTPFMQTASDSALSRGNFITALSDFSITSLGIGGDPAASSFTLFANIYAATGNTRGSLLLSASMTFADSGLGFYDVPINFTFLSGVDYDINISFGGPTGATGIFSPQYFPFDNQNNIPANFFSVGAY